jgi:hypothetical protein
MKQIMTKTQAKTFLKNMTPDQAVQAMEQFPVGWAGRFDPVWTRLEQAAFDKANPDTIPDSWRFDHRDGWLNRVPTIVEAGL